MGRGLNSANAGEFGVIEGDDTLGAAGNQQCPPNRRTVTAGRQRTGLRSLHFGTSSQPHFCRNEWLNDITSGPTM
jgi:hypothetical protein